MDNKEIVKNLRQLASFMELHGENEFKIRGYNNAVYNIERINEPLENLSLSELEQVNGVGKTIAARINELIETGKIAVLEKLMNQTPEGVVEMMNIKGLGTKKIRSLWQELDITSVDQLQEAINEGRLHNIRGFGGKVQETIRNTIKFYRESQSKTHFFVAEAFYKEIEDKLSKQFPKALISPTGELRRKMEVIDSIAILVGYDNYPEIADFINNDPLFSRSPSSSPFTWRGLYRDCPVPVEIHLCNARKFYSALIITTGSIAHLSFPTVESLNLRQLVSGTESDDEAEAYSRAGLPYIEPELREGLFEFEKIKEKQIPELLKMEDLKGIIHNHSHYSDGRHSLQEMAEFCKSLGYEYLGISDHSKAAAFYANGMDEDRVKMQHEEIDKLNEQLAPFRIFKGIEADILPDGNLDYDPEILATFDFVIASIHSAINMDIQKSMDRMLKAVRNPFTTFLGHLTGRQLLIREGYPLDHKVIIEECARHGVIIEINSHPNRLDLDWRWIPYALQKNVMLSINPDAHSKEGYHDMYYGVCVARKGGLTSEMTFNTKSLNEVEAYFQKRKQEAAGAFSMK